MKTTVTCSGCSNLIASDETGRLPPWCPRCGASFKKSPEALRSAAPNAAGPANTPAGAAQEELVEAVPHETLPYFHACVPTLSSGDHELFRVYLAESDLLVLRLGVGDVNLGNFQPRTKPRHTGGGLPGGMAYLA